MSVIEITGLAAMGLLAGTFGAMVGIGGGVIFVPVFLLVFGFSPQQAIGTSLVAVFLNACSGAVSYLRQKRVDIRAGWKFAVGTLPGAFLGAWLAGYFTPFVLGIVFGLMLALLSLFIFFRGQPRPRANAGRALRTLVDCDGHSFTYCPREGLGMAVSFLVGVVSSLLGIGGGVIHVPALIYLLGFPVHIATATSLFVLVVSTLVGSVTHLAMGNVQVLTALTVGIAAIPGAQLGAALSRRTRGPWIARLLAVALAGVGVRLLLKSLGIM